MYPADIELVFVLLFLGMIFALNLLTGYLSGQNEGIQLQVWVSRKMKTFLFTVVILLTGCLDQSDSSLRESNSNLNDEVVVAHVATSLKRESRAEIEKISGKIKIKIFQYDGGGKAFLISVESKRSQDLCKMVNEAIKSGESKHLRYCEINISVGPSNEKPL